MASRDLFLLCVVAAILVGWIGMKWYPFGIYILYLGVAGGVPFLLINGVHSDMGGVGGVIGGILFVLVNACVYYGIARWIISRKWSVTNNDK